MQICGLEAVIRRRPKRFRKVKPDYVAENILTKEGECTLLHSDRGYQYSFKAFKRILEKADMTHSISRVGRCIDNGPIEAFWGTWKVEKYYSINTSRLKHSSKRLISTLDSTIMNGIKKH